ncbi:MAG TPA: NAD(P)-dependent alcohol dehydrogenase, partial [Myxococcota bacterium]
MSQVIGYAASNSLLHGLKPIAFERLPPRADEVQIDIRFCGVCHSDVHQVKNEWKNTVYPCVPGHEIVGVISAVGSGVQRHRVGDLVGVGCMIDSCGSCDACASGEEQYCEGENSWLATYNGPMVPKDKAPTKTNMYGRDNTFGGYSQSIVVKEKFVLRIPAKLDPAAAAPILCAGVTMYSPLKTFGVKAGDTVGIVGLGGLGHLAVQLARAMGAEVFVFTTSKDKVDEAHALGAVRVVQQDDTQAFADLKGRFDFMLSTVPEKHDVNPFIALLKRDRTLVVAGAIEPLEPIDNMEMAMHRKRVAGTLIGSLKETQAVLDFCAQHGIAPL